MHINWYPGHMKKTKELITANLKLIDVVIELLDARIPVSSQNPIMDELVGHKLRVVILNKCDLCDQRVLGEWIDYFKNKGIVAVPVNSLNGQGLNKLLNEVKLMATPMFEKMKRQGRRERAIRVMIVGIPNVGKSSLINKFVGKKSAKTGNRPGVTKGKQWIRIRKDLELFDTPGILWPKIEDKEVGLNLAFTGAIRDEILNKEELSYTFIKLLMKKYPELLEARYSIELDEDPVKNLNAIGKRRACLSNKEDYDYLKIANILFDEFRKGVLGQITLETPRDVELRALHDL